MAKKKKETSNCVLCNLFSYTSMIDISRVMTLLIIRDLGNDPTLHLTRENVL